MADAPLLSVIIVTRNNGAHLPRTIQSLHEQTFKDYELLIVDDGSTDGTWEMIDRLKWQQMRAHRNVTPRGEAAAMNQAFDWAQGEYVALHRSGDRSDKKRLQEQVSRMKRGRTLAAIGACVDWVDENGELLRRWEPPSGHKSILLQLQREGEAFSMKGVPLAAMQGVMMFRAEAVEKVGGLREEMGMAAVLDLWRRLGDDYKLANLKEVLYTAYFDPDAPVFSEYFEGRIYAALALQLAQERKKHQKERTDYDKAIKLIAGRGDQMNPIARRKERAENYIRWTEQFEQWGDAASEHVQEMWLRALTAWPFNSRVWQFATRRIFGDKEQSTEA